VASYGKTEDGDGEVNGHGLIEELFQHLPRRSLEDKETSVISSHYLVVTLTGRHPSNCL